jgi:ABC-type sugar transport system permease subunit
VPLVVNQGTGDPVGTTMFYNLYLYKTFFTFQNMSYGSTLAWFLFHS